MILQKSLGAKRSPSGPTTARSAIVRCCWPTTSSHQTTTVASTTVGVAVLLVIPRVRSVAKCLAVTSSLRTGRFRASFVRTVDAHGVARCARREPRRGSATTQPLNAKAVPATSHSATAARGTWVPIVTIALPMWSNQRRRRRQRQRRRRRRLNHRSSSACSSKTRAHRL